MSILTQNKLRKYTYIHTFDCLEEVHHQMEEGNLVKCMSEIEYQIINTTEQLLPNGKKFVRLDFAQ